MKALTHRVLAWRTRQRLKKGGSVARTNIPYYESQKVGLIFSVEDMEKHEAIKHLVHMLEQDKKQVTVLSYLPKGKENYKFKFDFFSETSFTLSGNVKSENILNFINTKFDYIFHIDPRCENIMIDYILVQSKATCRIGICENNKTEFYELIYKPTSGKNIKSIVEEVLNYTKALTKV